MEPRNYTKAHKVMPRKFGVHFVKFSGLSSAAGGYTLLELVITLGVLAVLVMGTIPLADNAVKRQKEQKLREALRQMRTAIDEFKRDTIGACTTGAAATRNQIDPNQALPADPRSRVIIDDCKIFESDNLDRYPPDLETLVNGVRVKSRSPDVRGSSPFDDKNATDILENKEVTKVYLREIPVDPFTGEKDWRLRSSYQDKDSENWDEVNVFDVRSAANGEALNGEKYSDW
ncbi:MAG: type II secretion system protein [Pyrinomonadaceae bacterium]